MKGLILQWIEECCDTLKKKETQDKICHVVAPIGTFWVTMLAFQRSAGAVGYYSGRVGSTMVGFSAVCAGSWLSDRICERIIYPSLECCKEDSPWWREWLSLPFQAKQDPNDVATVVCRTGLSTIFYPTLTMNGYQTVFPSSILTIGGYARGLYLPYSLSGAVPSTSPRANLNERIAVNKKGRIFGCHHCGSRQILSRQKFIADHMPPTKMANEMNESWWRKLLNIKVKQGLWPQCQSCFQMQGSAVRANEHRLVFVHALRMHHLSFVFAVYVTDSMKSTKLFEECMNYAYEARDFAKALLDKIK